MVLVYLANDECIELDDAVEIETEASALVCLDRNGQEVARFDLRDVQSYTSDPEHVQIIRDEVCEEDDASAKLDTQDPSLRGD